MNALKCVNPYQNLTIENVDGVDIKFSTFEDAISYVVKPNHDKNYISETVLKELKKQKPEIICTIFLMQLMPM